MTTVRSVALVVWGVLVIVENGVATAVAVNQRWPAAFGVTADPAHITVVSGSSVSAPLAPLLVLALSIVLVMLPWRWVRITGAIGAAVLGVLMSIGNLGEPTMFHPKTALEAFFHMLGLVFAVALIGLGALAAVADLRTQSANRDPSTAP